MSIGDSTAMRARDKPLEGGVEVRPLERHVVAAPPRPSQTWTGTGGKQIPALTGVRGIAALLVAVYHFFLPEMAQGSVAHLLFGRGYLYVDLFFILSGAMMAMNYGALFTTRVRPAEFGSFMWRRFARVYPLYGVVTLAMIVGYWLVYGDFEQHDGWVGLDLSRPWWDIPANLILVQAWGFASGVVGQAWSVSVEVAAYLIFPWIVVLLRGCGPKRVLATVAAAAMLIPIGVWLSTSDDLHHVGALDLWNGPPALLRCAGGFIIGVALVRIASWSGTRIAFTDGAGVCVLGAYVALLLGGAPDLALYPALPLLILCLMGNQGRVGHAFSCRPVYALGVWSYAFYLLHVYFIPPTLELRPALESWLPAPAAWVVATTLAFGALLGASALAYVGIEKPGRRLFLKWVPDQRPMRTYSMSQQS